MKLLVSTFCSILLCALGTTSVPAQAKQKAAKTKPDFTGTWLLDTAKSNVGSSETSDQPIKITHHDPEFRITRMVASNGQVNGRDFVYYTDGRGETNSTMVFRRAGLRSDMVNSLECGGPAPLWSAATGRRSVESTQAAWPRQVATGQSAAWPAHSKENGPTTRNLFGLCGGEIRC